MQKTNFLDDPDFWNLVQEGSSEHRINVLAGDLIVKFYPKPLESLLGISRDKIIKVLIATCSTKEQINELLKKSGFPNVMIDVMEKPVDEAGKLAMLFCELMCGVLTREGLPVNFIDFDEK